ncbi:MAG: RnfABCDGE type electron transport complex subunit G [Cyclobacteriaceae bacterium]|nr:RnfABCDGE type electron transport complex subunit G [Cyclobacteriaceae bacterium HetDA_MAG_MS6]
MNSQKESSLLQMVLTLAVVTGVSAISLGFVFEWTKIPIEQAQQEKQLRAIRSVAGIYDNNPLEESYSLHKSGSQSRRRYRRRYRGGKPEHQNEVVNTLKLYPVRKGKQPPKFAIRSVSSKGYSGDIQLMVGVDSLGIVEGIEVLAHRETPGLGSKIKDKSFIKQFIGKSLGSFDFRVKQDGGDVDAISGATISSRAFGEAVREACQAFKDQKDEESLDP